jgi:hypothetical protein
MRNLVTALLIMVIFACILFAIAQPSDEIKVIGSSGTVTQGDVGNTGQRLAKDTESALVKFEVFTLQLEINIVNGGHHVVATFLALTKLTCLAAVFGIIPIACIVGGKSHCK